MNTRITSLSLSVIILLFVVVSLFETLGLFFGPFSINSVTLGDIPYFIVVACHFFAAVSVLFLRNNRKVLVRRLTGFIPEILFFMTLVFFLFSYIFALNANMDYIQRYAAQSGNIRLSLDTTAERTQVFFRYGPLLLLHVLHYCFSRFLVGADPEKNSAKRKTGFALIWVFVASVFSVLSFPSFVSTDGFGLLSFIALVPYYWVLRKQGLLGAVFYTMVYGVITVVLVLYWLGTFSLVSLQLVIVYFLFQYAVVGLIFGILKKFFAEHFLLFFPLLWVFFEYVRSLGFLAFPWAFWGSALYQYPFLIQIAELTGVWGVSFLVVTINVLIAEAFSDFNKPSGTLSKKLKGLIFRRIFPMAVLFLIFIGFSVVRLRPFTNLHLSLNPGYRVALIQHNSDARKSDYDMTLKVLKRLTSESLKLGPDLIAWSETAFVPNIRRWSQEDPQKYSLAKTTQDFLDYVRVLETPLLTGNDDYIFEQTPEGRARKDYNAAILFDRRGKRGETYHKIQLVPFTESFPYKKQFPKFHELLLQFDVNLWEPGDKRLIFDSEGLRFFTPICFEDVFPDHIRRFVLHGCDVILNISNDYWSLTEVEAQQHVIGSLFRAIENRKPLLRSTASGVTCYIDRYGRIIESLPLYTEDFLVIDITLQNSGETFYTRFGDWFPSGCGIALFFLLTALSIKNSLINRRNI